MYRCEISHTHIPFVYSYCGHAKRGACVESVLCETRNPYREMSNYLLNVQWGGSNMCKWMLNIALLLPMLHSLFNRFRFKWLFLASRFDCFCVHLVCCSVCGESLCVLQPYREKAFYNVLIYIYFVSFRFLFFSSPFHFLLARWKHACSKHVEWARAHPPAYTHTHLQRNRH